MYREEDHPRDRDGRFTEKGASEGEKLREAVGIYSDDPEADAEYIPVKAELTKRDWARLYQRLGEIERGAPVEKLANGEMIFPLHKMDEGDVPKVVIVGGTYESPKMKTVISFQSEEEMYEWLGDWKWH